ncbi:MAG TPA: hypothetical protein VGO40_10545 [Longimicrobium sp.]|jgi:hypothetical protein|nr:hypothetical protein [Longimicrobium sp.]
MPENDATSSAAATLDPPVPEGRAASGGGGSAVDIPPPAEPSQHPEPAARDEKPAAAADEPQAETPPAPAASAAAAAGPTQKTVFEGEVSAGELNVAEQQRRIEAHEVTYVEQQHQVNQYFDRQERLTVRSFSITDTSPIPELDEQGSRARFAGADEEGEALLLHLSERRVLLLSADHGARKAMAGTYLGWRLRQGGSCHRPILLAESLDRRVRVDFSLVLKEPEFVGRVLIFRNAFSRGNPDLLALFERTERTGWEQLGARLRERNAYLVFTARPDEVAPFRGAPAVQAVHRELAPHSRERVAGDFADRLGELEARGDVAPALLAALREHRDALLGHFAFAGLLVEFVDFFVAMNRPSLPPDEALRRFRDTSEWLLHNLAGDLEAWSFGFTLALAQCLRDAPPIAWLDFDRLHRHVARWLRRDAHLFPPAEGGAARDAGDARPSLSDESLLKRCQAEVVKDAATLADVVRFRGGGPPERLWEVMLDRHRRVLTAVLPRLRALAESEQGAEPPSLRILAAQLIGRIGEMDPQRIVVPVVDEWVASPDRRRQAAIGALYQGVVASGREPYRRVCFRHLQRLQAQAAGAEDGNARLVAVIAAYARVGEYELALAMRELGAIAREHVAPLIGDVGRLSRLMANVENKFQEQLSTGEGVALLLVHSLLRDLIFRVYSNRGGALLALQLALTLLCRRTEPIRVFGELRMWIAEGGWKLGALVALMFLHEEGIAAGVAEARDEEVAAGDGAGVARNPIVLSLAAGEDEVDQMAGFLGDLYQSVSTPFAAAPDLKRVCRESLLAHLTRWVRDALPVPGHLAAMQRLSESLARTHRGILREPLQQMLARQEFARHDGELHAFAQTLAL